MDPAAQPINHGLRIKLIDQQIVARLVYAIVEKGRNGDMIVRNS